MNGRISKPFGVKKSSILLSHNKHRSMGCSPADSPFIIKKQAIRIKEDQKLVATKWSKLKRKQATNHHNQAYQILLKQRKEVFDWIKYNMTFGLTFIWNRLRQQLKKLSSFYQNSNLPSNNVSKNQDLPLTPASNVDRFNNLFENLNNLFEQLNKNLVKNQKNKKSLFRVTRKQNRKLVRVSQDMDSSYRQMKEVSKSGDGQQHINKLGQNVYNLNSMLCLLEHDILLRKQEVFVDEFLKRGGVRKSVKQMQQITHILKISQQRCRLMKQMIQNMHLLQKNQKAIIASQKIIDKLSQIDLEQEIASIPEHYKENAVKSRFRQIKQAITRGINSSPIPLGQSNQNLRYSETLSKVSQGLLLVKVKRNQRASIQQHLNILLPPVSQSILKQKFKSSFKMTDQNDNTINLKKTVKKVHLVDSKQNIEISNNKKPQSGIMIKSKREIKWEDLNDRQAKSLRYLRSLRSLRSITSQSSVNSSKFLRSQKTQREMKFLKLKYRRIRFPAFLRTNFLKIDGLQDFQNQTLKDCLVLTSDRNLNKTTSLEKFQQCQQLIIEKQNIQEYNSKEEDQVWLQPNSQAIKKQQESEVDESLKKLKIKKQNRGIKRKQCISSHPILKEDVLRSFFSHFGSIKNEKNLMKQKYLVLHELQQMKQGEVISIQQYENFKGLFQRQPKVNPSIQKGDQKKDNQHYYLYLADLRSKISETTQLNQINKYYYNINQFKIEEEQIEKTKNMAPPKEDFLFQIKTNIFNRQNEKPKISFKKNYSRRQSSLLQKDI